MLGKYLTPVETLLDLGVFLSSKPTNHTHVDSFHLHFAPGTDKSSKACLWSKSFNCLINFPANYSTVSTLGEMLLSPTKSALDCLKLCLQHHQQNKNAVISSIESRLLGDKIRNKEAIRRGAVFLLFSEPHAAREKVKLCCRPTVTQNKNKRLLAVQEAINSTRSRIS